MAVVSAAIESNGWVLRVTGDWDASTFASFDLDPDGAPKVLVASTSAGFNRAGGVAVAAPARPRGTIVATKPLRRPYPNDSQLDEADEGGGVRTVRLALSRYIYPGDPVTASFSAGWRAGQAAAPSVAVTNNSAHAKPLPSMRWACPTFLRETGPFRVDLLVAAIEAEGKEAVAAVKFVCYDGTNSYEQWVDSATVSDRWGDNLKCWGATLNPTGLLAGLITVHAEVYPWIGAMRQTGSGHSTDNRASLAVSAETPLQVAWDPAGTRYPDVFVYIDPVNGTTTAAATMVQATLALAKAVAPAARAANINTAEQAIYLSNRSAPAALGYPAITRMEDNAHFVLAPGTHGWTTATPTFGLQALEARVIIEGDPDDADPKANCILQTAPSYAMRGKRWLARNLTLEMGGNSLPTGTPIWHWDNCIMRGKPGQETATLALNSAVAGRFNMSATRTRWWRYGLGMETSNRFGLIRNCETARNFEAMAVVSCTKIADPVVTGNHTGLGGWINGTTTAEGHADVIHWGNIIRGAMTSGLDFGSSTLSSSPTSQREHLRYSLVNCIIERLGPSINPVFAVGELTNYSRARYCLIENSTIVGERLNWGYNNPADGVTNVASFGNSLRGSFFDWLPSKHDVFTQNGALTAGWSQVYGVEFEGNVFGHRTVQGTPAFAMEYTGLRTVQNPVWNAASWPEFASDFSKFGTNAGFGDYRPTGSSPLLTILGDGGRRARRACIDLDVLGTARSGASWNSGAITIMSGAPDVVLAPRNSSHEAGSGPSQLGWQTLLPPFHAELRSSGVSARLSVSGGEVPPVVEVAGVRTLVVEGENPILRVRPE